MHVRLRLIIGIALVAGGAIVAAVSFWPVGSDKAASCSGLAAAPLSARGQQALAALKTSIRYEIEKSSDGTRNETWTDPVTGQSRILSFDNQGLLTSETGLTWAGKTLRSVTVPFGTRTWILATTTSPYGYTSGDTSSAADSLNVRQAIANGTATTLGPAVMDGRTTLHLREQHLELWVDPFTYLPVHTEVARAGHGVTDDITWLPRTASNLIDTRIVVPQGFTRATAGTGSVSEMETATTTCGQS